MAETSTATRWQLGRALKELRMRAGLNTTQVAALIKLKDPSTYRKYEAGKVTIPYANLEVVLDRLQEVIRRKYAEDPDRLSELLIGEYDREVLQELREQAENSDWWSAYGLTENVSQLVEFESMATKVNGFELTMVPGPLQTEDYARALIRGLEPPHGPEEEVEKRVRLRMERQNKTYMVKNPPELRIILDEPVIRRRIGGSQVMAAQLRWLASLTEPCELRILPMEEAPHPGMKGTFYIFEFDPTLRGPAIYVESVQRSFYLDARTMWHRLALTMSACGRQP